MPARGKECNVIYLIEKTFLGRPPARSIVLPLIPGCDSPGCADTVLPDRIPDLEGETYWENTNVSSCKESYSYSCRFSLLPHCLPGPKQTPVIPKD